MENWLVEERMMKAMIQSLRDGSHSLVVCPPYDSKEDISMDTSKTFDGRGVSDLYRLLHDAPHILQEALLADKVVGKGAAALMVIGKVKAVHAEIISKPALSMLEKKGIRTTYTNLVPHIVNRTGTGLCPMEARCMDCKTPEECLAQIESFLYENRMKKIQMTNQTYK